MKIRLMGTKEEIENYLKSIPKELILEQSGLYANRGNSKFYRCYLEVKMEKIIPYADEIYPFNLKEELKNAKRRKIDIQSDK